MSLDQLGGLDAAFLYCETPTMHMHVCGLLILDVSTMPSGYSYDHIRSVLMDRLPTIPSVRQKPAAAPLGLGRPFWIDDPDLDIDRHLHRLVLDSPGDERSLADVVGDIASRQLSRDRALWEIWVIEGLARGHVAVLVKMHHSIIDGVSGASIMGHLLDLEPAPPARPPSQTRRSKSRPSSFELIGRAVVARLIEPFSIARLAPTTAVRLATTVWRMGKQSDGVQAAKPFSAPRTPFNATITARRSVAFGEVALADIKTVKNAFGVTVNDAITAVVGGALRRYLESRDELPVRSLVAAAPVSVHDQTESRAGTTKLSVIFSSLATDQKDPVERLRTIASANDQAKEIQKMVGADTLVRWAEHFWPNSFALGARLYSTLHMADHHRVVHNLILSNVPGPPVPLYMAGARLVEFYPLGPIMDGAGLNVTALSQGDRVGFGIVTCPDLVSNVWDIADEMPRACRAP